MIDYITLQRENTTKLEVIVREYIRKGYTPIDSLFYDGKNFYQAMVKKGNYND